MIRYITLLEGRPHFFFEFLSLKTIISINYLYFYLYLMYSIRTHYQQINVNGKFVDIVQSLVQSVIKK